MNPERVAAERIAQEAYRSSSETFYGERLDSDFDVNAAERIIREAYAGEAKPDNPCPRCEGHRKIYDYEAMAPAASDFSRSFDQEAYVIDCPACQGSGLAPSASSSDELVKVRGAIQSSLTLLRMIRDKRTEDWVGILNLTDEHGAALAVKAWDDLKAAERILKTLK